MNGPCSDAAPAVVSLFSSLRGDPPRLLPLAIHLIVGVVVQKVRHGGAHPFLIHGGPLLLRQLQQPLSDDGDIGPAGPLRGGLDAQADKGVVVQGVDGQHVKVPAAQGFPFSDGHGCRKTPPVSDESVPLFSALTESLTGRFERHGAVDADSTAAMG